VNDVVSPGDPRPLHVVIFCHSLVSDWNHGNAHFLRGIVRELQRRGHRVTVHEPADGWSLTNLRSDQGEEAVLAFERAFPDLSSRF
jgi:spore maturation protein CgeB